MRKLCKMMESFDKSDEVFERLTHLFDFSIVEVIDTAFHLLNKFPNNPYLQAQCVCLIRHITFTYKKVPSSQGNKQKYIGTIVEAIRIVNTCITIDDAHISDTKEMLSGFTNNCIMILSILGAKDKKDGVDLTNLTKMYHKYVEFEEDLDKNYNELF